MYCILSKKKYSIVILLLTLSQPSFSQNRLDSIFELKDVVVEGRSFTNIIPAQTLKGEQLKRLSTVSVADAIRYFSGIQIKDYGGIGSLKTDSIHSHIFRFGPRVIS